MMNTLAAILVGGKGTRLQSVISDVPKPLAPIHGKPFLFHLIELLQAQGIKHILLLTSYMHEKIFEACGNGEQWNINITYSRENEPLGTAGALRHAEKILSRHENFLLLNGDTYFDASIKNIIDTPLDKNIFGLIGVNIVDDANRFGSVLIDPDTFQIKSFLEKCHASRAPFAPAGVQIDNQPSCQHAFSWHPVPLKKDTGCHLSQKTLGWHDKSFVNAGIYKLSSKIISMIPENKFVSLEKEIFPTLIQQDYFLKAIFLEKLFHDIGTPESYFAFMEQTK